MADINFSNLSASPLTPTDLANAAISFIKQNSVKTAPIDTVLFDDGSVAIEAMTDIVFENIGGHELINISRNDTINGQGVSYNVIKNLTAIQQEYNPLNLVGLQGLSDKIFNNFPINLNEKVPTVGNGPGGSNVYFNAAGDLVVELVNLNSDEQVEVQISLSGTIYEAYLGEATS
jgi:hypothetical protein